MSVSIRATGEKDDTGRPEWLRVIHQANELDATFFGEPISTGPWWAGGHAEEYAHARVVIDPDGSARIVSLTEHGADILRRTAEAMNIHHQESKA